MKIYRLKKGIPKDNHFTSDKRDNIKKKFNNETITILMIII